MRALALECKPKMIVSGASAYPRTIDFEKIRAICDEVGALMMVDIAHIAGLVAAGQHPSPVPYADFVTTTTHKTLRGPRGGMIMCREQYGKAIDKAIFPGTQGGPLEHVIAAKAVCFGEALKPEFKEYARKIVENAKALEAELTARGVKLAAATSSPREHVTRALERLGLLGYFTRLFTTAEVGVSKHEPTIYLLAAEALLNKMQPGDALLVKASRGMALEKALALFYPVCGK